MRNYFSVIILIAVFSLNSFCQNDTLESTQLKLFVKNNDWSKKAFYKIGDTIPFTGFMVEYFPNTKQINWIVKYKNGQVATGLHSYYYEDGNKKTEEYSNNSGVRFGKFKEWYDNGQLKSRGEYENDEKNGVWSHWDINGNLISTETYKNGVITKKN